jgi:4-amino-4-deoxy-L-arabinose transferase-like glycosyltransferase
MTLGQRKDPIAMPETRLGLVRLALIVGLSSLTLGIGLGGSGRLTYHEAFVAQGAREMIASGSILVPTIDGQPWLEKPPLAFWLVAEVGKLTGGVSEFVARLPSAIAATLLAVGIAVFASRRFGPDVGWLAGLIQASTFWFVVRGRLAEADILLACLVTWAMVAFDRIRTEDSGLRTEDSGLRGPHWSLARRALVGSAVRTVAVDPAVDSIQPENGGQAPAGYSRSQSPIPRPTEAGTLRLDAWKWAFFGLLGAMSLVKGVGFGSVLAGSAMAMVLLWDRDRLAWKALRDWRGWTLAAVLALTWPVLVAIRLPAAVSLWTLHVTDRLATHPEVFIGGPWWQYGPAVLGQALPWTPLALLGAWPSLIRAVRGRGGVDRLLWAWAVVPVLVLSAATVKNAHYAIHALPPLAVWAALGLDRVGFRLNRRRAWPIDRLKLGASGLFVGLGLVSGFGHLVLGPRFDHRGVEWGWTARVGRELDPKLPLVFLYEDWDRKPYPTPFGSVPHDWAVRLYYLERPASWRQGIEDLIARPPAAGPYALLGRERDLPALQKLGRVEPLMKGPADRFDREFVVFRITPNERR